MTKKQLLEQAHPILFNTDMVLAILDGRKTATRRLIKQPYFVDGDEEDPRTLQVLRTAPKGSWLYRQIGSMPYLETPYRAGDILYVRETWCKSPFTSHYVYKADGDGQLFTQSYDSEIMDDTVWKWHPSIHMPKAAVRIFLKVTDIRVERLQDMNLDDFLSEGVEPRPEAFNDPENAYQQAKKIFQSIWNSTIPKAEQNSYSWEANPWVWVIEFERVIPELAAGLKTELCSIFQR